MSESMEQIEARHRKELKALEGEKRAALKKAKGTKGKKAKDELESLEAEFETKLNLMNERHGVERQAATNRSDTPAIEPEVAEAPENDECDDAQERQRKMEKLRRKREKTREKEREREQRIAAEAANAGPAARDVEMEAIQRQLAPLDLRIQEVEADGHCLYRAVAAQCGTVYTEVRRKCADIMLEQEEDFSPFCELSDDIPDFQTYVDRVRSSADWGGHLELRALSVALKRPIVVYSTQSQVPLVIKGQVNESEDPIRLSFHLNYYALGEHYNQVVPMKKKGNETLR